MTGFGKVSPGEPADLIYSARFQNAVIDLLAADGALEETPGFETPFDRQSTVVKIKNTHSSEVPRGGVLGVGAVVIDADENEPHFLDADPCFSGVAPTELKHGARFCISLGPLGNGKIGPCVASGWVPAKVNVISETHITAKIVDDDVDKLESSPDGSIPLVIAQSGTGEKWCLIKVPASSVTRATPGISSSTAGTKAEWVPAETSIKDGCIHVWPLITPDTYDESVTYESGDKILRPTSDDCLEKIIWKANATTTGTFDASKWDEKTGRRYIDKTATPEKWWHGMSEAPEEGHYCVGVKDELVYYDCFELPNYS